MNDEVSPESVGPKVIWGTNIVITDIIASLKLFFTTFANSPINANDDTSPKYLDAIIRVFLL